MTFLSNSPAGHDVLSIVPTDWAAAAAELGERGYTVLERLVPPEQCKIIASYYSNDNLFRSRIVMDRHGFGKGEYKYFSYPLPSPIGELRTALYSRFVPVANEWNARMGLSTRYPAEIGEFLKLCHAAGQTRPTPLVLRYEPGDFNCLHQDLYGELAFPLQVTVLLSKPAEEFAGGEFILTEQRPRMQSRAEWCRCGKATRWFSLSIIDP